MPRRFPQIDQTRTYAWGRSTISPRTGGLRGNGLTKHLTPSDISDEEIEARYRAALWHIRERSRRRRLEVEPIRFGRGDAA